MFTGLIQDVGRVAAAAGGVPRRLAIETALPAESFARGESVAINGACLTVVANGRGRFEVEAAGETLRCTTLGRLKVGDPVNLERALTLADRLGGHLVLGHVDGMGRIVLSRPEGGGRLVEIEAPPELLSFLLPKGSVAVDGVSLTVNVVRGNRFEVLLIPETLQRTQLGGVVTGDGVNLEADVLGKYVARLLSFQPQAAGPIPLDLERLKRAGFA